jgi:hypothetical protein
MKKNKKMDSNIQQWQITTFNQTVVSIDGEPVGKTLAELVEDDPSFDLWGCGASGVKYLYSTALTSDEVEIEFSVNGTFGGVIIVGTHPTCS